MATAGRPPWEPTEKQRAEVRAMAGRGVPEKMIAAVVGVDKITLRKHCADDLLAGRSVAVTNVLGALYTQAMKGEYKHAQLYLANTIGWHLSQRIEHAGVIDTARLERGKARAIAAATGAVLQEPDGGEDDSDAGDAEP